MVLLRRELNGELLKRSSWLLLEGLNRLLLEGLLELGLLLLGKAERRVGRRSELLLRLEGGRLEVERLSLELLRIEPAKLLLLGLVEIGRGLDWLVGEVG